MKDKIREIIKTEEFKNFVKDGFKGLFILIIYEIILILLIPILGLFVMVLGWTPLLFGAILFKNFYLMIFSTIIFIFLIGGGIGMLIRKIKNKINKII